jgi:ABC-2 type transport system ATP-binding protein
MTAIIHTEKLTKFYGPHRGIVDVDLDVNEGEAFGFLGPNGAGKTTMIRVLLDHIRPTSGRATIFGIETRLNLPRSTLGQATCQAVSCSYNPRRPDNQYFSNLRGVIRSTRLT